jgi:hypothetical protein
MGFVMTIPQKVNISARAQIELPIFDN